MPRFAANLTLLFTEVPFADRFAAAARAGFQGVEVQFPYDYDKHEMKRLLDQHALTPVLFNLPAGSWSAGERGIACHPDRSAEFRTGVDLAIEYADTIGCRQVNCLAGIRPPGVDAETARRTFTDNLRFAAGRLERVGVRLLIEPINTHDVPGFFLCHAPQAADIVAEVASSNVSLQYDVYHAQMMEGDAIAFIESSFPLVGHLQVADAPGRHEPGTGAIDFPRLFSVLDRLGYRGWVGCEYFPATKTEDGLAWATPYLDRAPRYHMGLESDILAATENDSLAPAQQRPVEE